MTELRTDPMTPNLSWLLPSLARYATPEVATVAGALVAIFLGWKVLSWAVRSTTRLLGRLALVPVMIAALFIGGAMTTGWGVARWAEWVSSPTDIDSCLDPIDRAVLATINSTHDPDRIRAVVEYARLVAARSRAVAPPPATTGHAPPPRLDVGLTALFGGLASGIVALFWYRDKLDPTFRRPGP